MVDDILVHKADQAITDTETEIFLKILKKKNLKTIKKKSQHNQVWDRNNGMERHIITKDQLT